MIKKGSLLVVIVAVTGLALAVAETGSAASSHSVSQKGRLAGYTATSSTCSHAPSPGQPAPMAGNLIGKPGGSGGIVAHLVHATFPGYTGKATFFEPLGSYTAKITKTKAVPGHATEAKEVMKITKGTGSYKGATGTVTLTLNGGCPSSPFTVTGTIRY
jgi:hypothetical protein